MWVHLRVFAPFLHRPVTLQVCPFWGEKSSSVDVQRKEEITVGCAGEGMEEDSKISNRPGVIWFKDLVQHCSIEYKHLLTPQEEEVIST